MSLPSIGEAVSDTASANLSAAPDVQKLLANYNAFMTGQAFTGLMSNLPGGATSFAQAGENVGNKLKGIIGNDTIDYLTQLFAERGVKTGTGGSGSNDVAWMKGMYDTSDLMKSQGMTDLGKLVGMTPITQLMNPSSGMATIQDTMSLAALNNGQSFWPYYSPNQSGGGSSGSSGSYPSTSSYFNSGSSGGGGNYNYAGVGGMSGPWSTGGASSTLGSISAGGLSSSSPGVYGSSYSSGATPNYASMLGFDPTLPFGGDVAGMNALGYNPSSYYEGSAAVDDSSAWDWIMGGDSGGFENMDYLGMFAGET